MGSREEMEKLLFFETAREAAEADFKKNPKDAQALTRWGGALLELAHFRQGTDAVELIEQAVSKLQQAITLNPKKHDALWCLGNALTSQGFLYADSTRANDFFDKARDCFQRALDEEPRNETYKKALEMTHKAPYLHQELQKQLQVQQQQQQAQAHMQKMAQQGDGEGGSQQDEGVEFWYDVAGWVALFGLGTMWVMLSRASQK